MKYIRELRFGPPKCWKTGSIVSSYPRPLLVLNIDNGGLDVVREPIMPIAIADFETLCSRVPSALAPISSVDFYDGVQRLIMDAYQPQGNKKSFDSFIKCVNKLATVGCPWATVVLDGITGLDDIIKSYNAAVNPGSLGSALKWASNVGGKIQQIMGVMCGLPCHVVFISHASTPTVEEDTTKEIHIGVVMTSKRLRDIAGGLVSQFFYQCKEGPKTVVYTTDFGFVQGIGARWPANLPPKVGPTYKDIYEGR